ncbi:MAG TPA: YcgL domain-containing protein [Gammaproteobacteria bacterium]|nr:YcgL domain-containing protein [Gammaproteobacteria bacterium]
MQCFVYRSPRKADTFLYLAEKDALAELPAALLDVFGVPQFSFNFDLTPERKLAREDAVEVIDNLRTRGFHLQMTAENKEPI